MRNIMLAAVLFLFCGSSAAMAQSGKSTYTILDKIHIDGNDGWDYLVADETTNRVFISHGNMVQVLDVPGKKIIGVIPDTKGVHGIALAPDLNKGFVSDGRDSTITVFDFQTLKVLDRVKGPGANPDAILYDQFSHRVFVYNGRSANATVMDAKSDKIIGTIVLEGKPEFSVSDGKGKVYVNIEDKNQLDVINATTLKVEQHWPISSGEEPSGLALDNTTHRLFTVCSNKRMVVMNATTGKVVATLPIGDRCDGVAFDPVLRRAYASNGEGTITVVQEENENSFKVIETIETQKGARTITVNSKTHQIFLPTAEYGPTPEATKENPHPRPAIKPNTFVIIEANPIK